MGVRQVSKDHHADSFWGQSQQLLACHFGVTLMVKGLSSSEIKCIAQLPLQLVVWIAGLVSGGFSPFTIYKNQRGSNPKPPTSGCLWVSSCCMSSSSHVLLMASGAGPTWVYVAHISSGSHPHVDLNMLTNKDNKKHREETLICML